MIEILVGAILVALVMYDVFHTIIVPRSSPLGFRIAAFLGRRILWPSCLGLANSAPLKTLREDLLALYAPIAFALIFLVWVITLIMGYALILYGLRADSLPPITSFFQAFYASGSAVLTIGIGDLTGCGWKTRILMLLAALSGLALMALGISYLFTLQSLVQQREQVVNTVVSRAGAPASGIIALLRFRELAIMSNLGNTFLGWESWIASILESHRAYPFLLYFRSTNKTESWVSVLGAMLDAASLLLTTVKDESVGEAELFYWLACSTVQSLCRSLGIETTDHVRLSREEFDHGLDLLHAGGFELRDHDLAWKLFQVRRKAYIGYLYGLATAYSSPTHAWVYELKLTSVDRPEESIFQPQV
jgi:hypothetical protein